MQVAVLLEASLGVHLWEVEHQACKVSHPEADQAAQQDDLEADSNGVSVELVGKEGNSGVDGEAEEVPFGDRKKPPVSHEDKVVPSIH